MGCAAILFPGSMPDLLFSGSDLSLINYKIINGIMDWHIYCLQE